MQNIHGSQYKDGIENLFVKLEPRRKRITLEGISYFADVG